MKYGLTDEALARMEGVFAKFPAVNQVLLYGSRAKGNYRPGSDIDLTFLGDGVDEKLMSQIEAELEELLLPYQFDLSIFSKITHPELIDHIQRLAKVCYSKKSEP